MMDDLEVIRAIRITRILGLRDDRQLKIKCIFHNDSTPSLVVYRDNSYHCYGCGANGQNALDFALMVNGARDLRNVSKPEFRKAIEDLKDYL